MDDREQVNESLMDDAIFEAFLEQVESLPLDMVELLVCTAGKNARRLTALVARGSDMLDVLARAMGARDPSVEEWQATAELVQAFTAAFDEAGRSKMDPDDPAGRFVNAWMKAAKDGPDFKQRFHRFSAGFMPFVVARFRDPLERTAKVAQASPPNGQQAFFGSVKPGSAKLRPDHGY